MAWLALETCAEACWQNRAYGLYEPICRQLIGLDSVDAADLQATARKRDIACLPSILNESSDA